VSKSNTFLAIFQFILVNFRQKQLKNFNTDQAINKEAIDTRGFLHFHCNIDSACGWKPEYSEPLAEYFSRSDILSKYYRPFIDLVSGAKSITRILAEHNYWDLYEVYLSQELYIIEGIAIEKALNAVDQGEVKKSQNYLQLAGLASSHTGGVSGVFPAVIKTFKHMPTMLSRDRNSMKQLSEKKIKKPNLIPSAEEKLKPTRYLITAKSNGDNGSEKA